MRQSILIGATFGFILNFHSNYNPLELNKLVDRTRHLTGIVHMEPESKVDAYSLVLNSTVTKDLN